MALDQQPISDPVFEAFRGRGDGAGAERLEGR